MLYHHRSLKGTKQNYVLGFSRQTKVSVIRLIYVNNHNSTVGRATMNPKLFVYLFCLFLSFSMGEMFKGQNRLFDGEDSYRLYVKIKAELFVDLYEGKVRTYSSSHSPSSELLNSLNKFRYSQVVPLNHEERQNVRSARRPHRNNSHFDKTKFSGLLELKNAPNMNKHELLSYANELEKYESIEYCEITPVTPPPPPGMFKENSRMVRTPDFTADQFYLYGNSGNNVYGIYADYAWNRGITGQGVSIVDIEWGWDYLHEDFVGQNMIDKLTTTNPNYNDHGTAVAGQMFAAKNEFGVTGAVHGADQFIGISEVTKGRPSAIALAISTLEAGDVLVYEMQAGGKNNEYVPADISQTVWDLTKQASDAGIIVVAAAGNGGENLDDPYYTSYHARGDNGSIIVGAGTKVGRNRAGFSTYGERVDVCGIGDWTIVTTGYGGLHNAGPHATYTSTFSGTSSSTPIVASAVVAIQSYAKNVLGITLTPQQMRDLLKETGTKSGTGWTKDTPLPNVKAAIEKLDLEYEKEGSRFLLSVENGTGSGRYKEGETIEIKAVDSIGYTFESWIGDIQHLNSHTSKTASVTMPGTDITLQATYSIKPKYQLTVINGSGSGEYAEGDEITISANDSVGYLFDHWSGDISTLSNPNAQTITLTMSKTSLTLTAEYREFDLILFDQKSILFEASTSEWSNTYGNLKANDGDSSTFWHSAENVTLPQSLTYRLKSPQMLTGFKVLPRQDESDNGRIKEWRFEVSENGSEWSEIQSGIWNEIKSEKLVPFDSATNKVEYVRITALSSTSGEESVSIAEFNLFYKETGEVSLAKKGVLPETLSATITSNQMNLIIPESGNYSILFQNLRGQTIYHYNADLNKGTQKVPLGNLSAGMIIISIKGPQNTLVSKHIIQ